MARRPGANIGQPERTVLADKALALRLAGLTYEQIASEIGCHRNTVGPLLREAARRRTQDRDLTEEINRGVAIQRQLIEGMMRDFRSIGSGTPHRANARAKLASQIIHAQMNLLFLSGVEIPDPEHIVMDALEAMQIPIPELSELLSQPMDFPSAPKYPELVPDPPEDHVIPPHETPRMPASEEPDVGDEDDGGDLRYFDPPSTTSSPQSREDGF
jgi:hypothetical protein